MLKPVTILALDALSAPLAAAVQRRIADTHGLADLAQAVQLTADADFAQTIQSIHARRQRPDSPLRTRDDISTRELVLLVLSATGPARTTLLGTAQSIRQIYEMRRLASFFTIEILCLLPEATGASTGEDYAATYGLLKGLSAADPKPFNEVWLVDATNGNRVRFGSLETSPEIYADAIAGAVTFEPEMSGALPGIHPRGMPPAFSSFGYAELVFPREVALQRVQSRFAVELLTTAILRRCGGGGPSASLRAKQLLAGEEFAVPLSRIGVDAGQSLFRRFQPRTQITEDTRSADELIASVRTELQAYRDATHLANLETLARQGEQTANDLAVLLERTVDDTLDRDDYSSAIDLLEALLDPLPDLRSDSDPAPRNLTTEIHTATAALDARVGFAPNTAASDAARKRVRDLDALFEDQKLVADTLEPISAAGRLEEIEREKSALASQLPEIVFAEEGQNNAARNAAREAEAARLATEAETKEQQLRDLFAQRPRAEQALRDVLEARRAWIWRRILQAAIGVVAVYAVPFVFGMLLPIVVPITWAAAAAGVGVFAVTCAVQYLRHIAHRVREARETLELICTQIVTTDKAKNVAYNDELQFEYDVAHRRKLLHVLRRTREAAKSTLGALRTRLGEIEEVVGSFTPASIACSGLTISIVDDGDIDSWYERTGDDRKPFVRDFPIKRSESRHLSLEELRAKARAYAATAFDDFRELTLAGASTMLPPGASLARSLKRFVETSAPLIELDGDDLPAQQAIQRDLTLWIHTGDTAWIAQLQHRFPDSQVKPAPDALRVHALSRVLHYPGYVLGQIDYYRDEYQRSAGPDFTDARDLLPVDLAITGPQRAAYEQVLLGRAMGVVELRADGQLASAGMILGDSHLAAARRLASGDASLLREHLDAALAPRLSVAREVERDLRQLMRSPALSELDRGIISTLVTRYAMQF